MFGLPQAQQGLSPMLEQHVPGLQVRLTGPMCTCGALSGSHLTTIIIINTSHGLSAAWSSMLGEMGSNDCFPSLQLGSQLTLALSDGNGTAINAF